MKLAPTPKDLSHISDLEMAHLLIQELREKITSQEILIQKKEQENHHKSIKIEALIFELARYKRWKFAAKTEALSPLQGHLFEESLAEDIEAMESQLELLQKDSSQKSSVSTPKRQSFPESLKRIDHYHEPESCECSACGKPLKKIGEEISERLDCKPIEFFVHRHIRSKYACNVCESITAAPMPAQIIEKGQPAAGLLAQVLVSKYQDHMPLYRQEQQYQERSGVSIPRHTMAGWVGACGVALEPLVIRMKELLCKESVLHADETPVNVLKPGNKKVHKGYMWAYRTSVFSPIQAVIFDFQMSRSGDHPKLMLESFKGGLMVDDYAGYKALFEKSGCSELACLAHIRRKFFELHQANKSQIAEEALILIAKLYEVEDKCKDLTTSERYAYRIEYAKPILEKFKKWLLHKKTGVPLGFGIAKAIDYALKRWNALESYLKNGLYPIDNNACENVIRPIALGRKNWLFLGTEQSGKRAAHIMSLISSAKLNGLNPYEYLKDVLEKLPTWSHSKIDELLPYNWKFDL